MARRKASDPAARIGSLLINPGGPGGSGVDFAIFGAGYFGDEITRRFDLVGFDPRGVGRSNPVMCSLELLGQAPPPVVASQGDFDRLVDHNRRLAAEVLDGNLDRGLGVEDFLRTQAITAQDSFDEFVRGCTADPRCALYGRDIRALWADLLARAGRGEPADPFDPARRLAAFDLVVLAFSSFYGPDWFDLADHLAKLDAARPEPADPQAGVAGATGLAPAVATARQLGPRAALLTYEGWGHGGYGASECVTAAIDRYLISGEPPAAGTRCPGVAPEPPGIGRRPLIRSLPPGPMPTVPGWRPRPF